ncbi:MAG: hypothetical protein LQ345_002278 [Seirophora villosa]|nr:MAG: hypothetical protein LQ345_002278 [Seirophora villosa]
MIKRSRPKKKVGSPFFAPWSASESLLRRRVQKPKTSMATSFPEDSPVPLNHCSSRRSESCSTARTTDRQRSLSVSDLYRDWVPFLEAPPTPSKSQDGDETTSFPHDEYRASYNLSRLEDSPNRPSHRFPSAHDMDDEQSLPNSASFSAPGSSHHEVQEPSDSPPGKEVPTPSNQPSPPDRNIEQVLPFRSRRMELQTPKKASSASCLDYDKEQLRRRYRRRGRRIEDSKMTSRTAFSPDRSIPAVRRRVDIQRSMSVHRNSDFKHRIGDWVSNTYSQPGFPSTEPAPPPPAIIETFRGSPPEPSGSNPPRRSSASVKDLKHEQRVPNDPKPASTAASPMNRPRNKHRHPTVVSQPPSRPASPSPDRKPTRQDFKEQLLMEAMAWCNWRLADIESAICFYDTKPLKPWPAAAMKKETIRREHFVLTKQLLDPKPTPVFGTAKWYQLDRLRCWTNLNCHTRGKQVSWPEGYVPKFVEEAKRWDPRDDFSLVSGTEGSREVADKDDGTEGDESVGDDGE